MTYSCASLSGSGAGCSLRLLASLEKRELSEASEREAEEPRGETDDTEGAGLGSRSVLAEDTCSIDETVNGDRGITEIGLHFCYRLTQCY